MRVWSSPLSRSSLSPICLTLFKLHFSNMNSISSSSSSSPFSSIFSFSKRMAAPGSFRRFSEFFLLGFMILTGLWLNVFSARVRRLRRRQINTATTHSSNAPTTPATRPAIRNIFQLSSTEISLLDSVEEMNWSIAHISIMMKNMCACMHNTILTPENFAKNQRNSRT